MGTRSARGALGLLAAALATPSAAAADEPSAALGRARIGERVPAAISTPHPYPGGTELRYEIHHPGATYVKAHFSRFELAPGDRLVVESPDGRERYVFESLGYKQKGQDFWVNSVLGDTVVLRLQSVGGGAYGFDVDAYAHGIAPLFPTDTLAPESVCGTQDWEDVACYETSHPTEYDRALRAVVVLFNGVENCTGVKVGCPNQFLTNEHCVTNQAQVDVTEVRFEYQNSNCNSGPSSFSQSFLGDTFLDDDVTLDFCLFTAEGASPDYEAAEIDPRLPPVGERIYISGHPAGSPKKLSIEDTQNPTGLCRADISPIDGIGSGTDVGYFCDTTGGSSGSPVWSGVTHKLIALHHFGGCPNSGVRMDLIYPQISSQLMPCCAVAPEVPVLSAVPNGDNRIDLDWDDSDLATVIEYHVLRSRTPGGPYTLLATVVDTSPGVADGAGYSYADFDVSGGITYHYVVRATDGSQCTSDASAEAQATATGACTLPPMFAGLATVTAPALGVCTLDLAWSPAVAECGGPVTYDVYRSTASGFVPGAGNLLASGLTSTAFSDIAQLVHGTTYYYVVRATDGANGVADANTVERSGTPVGQNLGSTWTDDAGDSGPAELQSTVEWSVAAGQGFAGAGYMTGTYAGNVCAGLVSPVLGLGVGSELTFRARHDFETGIDKGEVQVSSDGGATWQRAPVDYPASAAGTTDACALPAGTYFSGTSLVWTEYTADLGAWAGEDVRIRWVLSSDGSTSGSGWWIDDVAVTNVVSGSTCATGSTCDANPFVDVGPEGPLTVCRGDGPTLTASLVGGTGPFAYQWINDGEPIPGADDPTFRPDELGVHRYNVRVRGAGCSDDVFDGVDTELYRVDEPFFDGIAAAVNPQAPTCEVELSWNPASTVCGGPVRYYVYRDTVSPVATTPDRLIASGLDTTQYTDTFALENETTVYYRVRARDGATGQFDDNTAEAAATPDGPGNGPNALLDAPFETPASFAQWTVTTGPGPHNCGAWALSTNAAQRPTGSNGNFVVADSNCGGLLPRTSAKIDSAPVSLTNPAIISVRLEASVRYGQGNGDDATIAVWNGSQWVVIWNDPNADFNQVLSLDVTQWAAGNAGFRVRFNYQNANADRFFAVDNVKVIATIVSACATAAAGPPAVPPDMRAGLDGSGAIDVVWDAASCPASGYNLLYGDLGAVSTYALLGAECTIGTSGALSWSDPPVGNLYFLVVSSDGAATEGSWGKNGALVERNGSAASGQCGATTKDVTHVCP